jgi:hypothetical protein
MLRTGAGRCERLPLPFQPQQPFRLPLSEPFLGLIFEPRSISIARRRQILAATSCVSALHPAPPDTDAPFLLLLLVDSSEQQCKTADHSGRVHKFCAASCSSGDPNGKRLPDCQAARARDGGGERAARLAKMMESHVNMEAPERVGLKTGYRCAPAAPQRWPRRASRPAPLLPEHARHAGRQRPASA